MNRVRAFLFLASIGLCSVILYEIQVGSKYIFQIRAPVLIKTTTRHPTLGKPILPEGESIRVGKLEVYILTAVHYADYPYKSGFNVLLNGWAKHTSNMDFKCCFLRSLPKNNTDSLELVEIDSVVHHEYTQWVVDMQNVEFKCSITQDNLNSLEFYYRGKTNFPYVTFAEKTCQEPAENHVMKIIYPQQVPASVGVCLKISYGDVDPEKAAEWFEYTKLMGVNKVFSYVSNLGVAASSVFDYHEGTGFLEQYEVTLPHSNLGRPRKATKPRYEEQAYVDEVTAINDCRHRMSGFEYVIVMDIDEVIIPKSNLKSYYDILKETKKNKPRASGFSFDAHIVMLDWGATRPDAPLWLSKYTNRTAFVNYNGDGVNTRWAFIPQPHMVYFAQNNKVWPQKGYDWTSVPNKYFTLLHYRMCKPEWIGCDYSDRVEEEGMVNYEDQIVEGILNMDNVDARLQNSSQYLRKLRTWKKERSKGSGEINNTSVGSVVERVLRVKG